MERKARTDSFLKEISAIPGGEKIRLCIQCGTCTASCPNADRMDHTPSQLIAMTRAGMEKEVLSSNAMWYCLSCYLCTVRCPRGIKPTDIMHAYEGLAVSKGLSNRRTRTPVMYKTFNQFVSSHGRLSEFWLMVRFYLSTNPLSPVGMLPLALNLFKHGRLSLKTEKLTPEGTKQLKAIVDKAATLGGVS